MTSVTQPDGTQNAPSTTVTAPSTPGSLDEAMALIENLRGINSDVIRTRDETKQKLRKYEEEALERERTLLAEQGKFKELYEASTQRLSEIESTLKQRAVDTSLRDAVSKSGARSVDTVAKLVDKSKIAVGEDYTVNLADIESQIQELKKTDPILFGVGGDANLPPVRRPSGGDTSSGFEQDMRAAKSQADIISVMKKYGKI